MELGQLAIVLLILVALCFLYYGWLRLRQEAEAKARQLIFRKSHREGEGAVARSHRVTPRSASAPELLDAAWAAIDVPEGTESLNWLGATIFKVRSDDHNTIFFTLRWKFGSPNWIAMLSLEGDGSLEWSVPQARQLNGLVPEAKSLANLERRVIRALRLCDPYCVITSEESKTQWKRQ